MTSRVRFTVLTEENPPSKLGVQPNKKRAPLGVLSDGQQNSNVPKPTESLKQILHRDLKKPLNDVSSKENCDYSHVTNDFKKKSSIQEKCEDIRHEMSPPVSIDSPMMISPAVQVTVPSIPKKKSTQKEDLLDDDFFTEQYGSSHYAYMREMELKLKPRQDYMSKQRDISSDMRALLIDWLVEVNEEYQMSDETLFLAVSLVDRFLSLMSVVRGKLQLVGTAAIFVASKVEEIYPPQISDMVYVTDDTYTAIQVARMEALLLKNLNFSIGCFHPLTFLRNLAVRGKLSIKVAHMAQYIAELSLLNINSLAYRASEIAAASLIVAMHQITGDTEAWTPELKAYADIDQDKLKSAVEFLHPLLLRANASAHQAIPGKYSQSKYSSVSLLEVDAALATFE